jgi:hypothetical protein
MARRPHRRPHRLLRSDHPGDLPGCGAASARGLARFDSCPAGVHRLLLDPCSDCGGAARLVWAGWPGRDRARPARAARSVVVPFTRQRENRVIGGYVRRRGRRTLIH